MLKASLYNPHCTPWDQVFSASQVSLGLTPLMQTRNSGNTSPNFFLFSAFYATSCLPAATLLLLTNFVTLLFPQSKGI